jgi:hypothetical protein
MPSTILRSPNLADGEEPLVVRIYEQPPAARFARGGLATAAHSVRSAGRGGDDVLLHINPKEYQFLKHMWGEPSTNPHTGLPEYGLFSKLKKALKFETFNVKNIIKDVAHNPQRLLTGAIDPIGTKLTNTVFGTHYKPVVNQLGGATEQRFRDAEAQGIDTGTARTLHGVAGAIAGFYGGNALGNLASEGLGSLSQGLQGTSAAGLGGDLTEAVPTVDTVGSTGAINEFVPTATRVGTGFTGTTGNALKDAAISLADKGQGALSNLDEKAVDYAKQPKNWGTIAKGVALLGALGGAGSTPADQGAAPATPTSPGLKQLAFNRKQGPQNFDWYTYGQGPEQSFYSDNSIPYFDPAHPDQTTPPPPVEPWMGGVPGAGNGPNAVGGAKGGDVTRFVRGPGTGRSDSIDAKLSDGEYVLTAEDVALLGDGSSEAGAKRLDEFRTNLRKHKGSALARGKISPNAKAPLAYLKGVR